MATTKKNTVKNEEAPKGEEVNAFEGTEAGNDLTKAKPSFTRKKAVSVPNLQIPDEETVFIRIDEPFFTGPDIDIKTGEVKKDDNGKDKEITIGKVIDLTEEDTMRQTKQLVFGTVLVSQLQREFPEDGYVGKSFEITKHHPKGKRYRTYEVYELDV